MHQHPAQHPDPGPSGDPPPSGDEGVDRILADFAARSGEDLAGRLDAATEAHRRLQERLTEPDGGPAASG